MASILVIEDDSQVLTLVTRFLEEAGHTVRIAVDGLGGLQAFRNTAPDLVITDVVMPGMDGLETMRRIYEASPKTKIVAMSGAGKGYLTQADELGAAGIIEKPFSSTELSRLVGDVLDERGLDERGLDERGLDERGLDDNGIN